MSNSILLDKSKELALEVIRLWIVLGVVALVLGIIAAVLFVPRNLKMDDFKKTKWKRIIG